MNRSPCAVLGLVVLAIASPLRADTIPGLFNTGVDGTGTVLGTGAVDPHYVLISSADPAHSGPAAYACSPIPSAYWQSNNAVSRWIAPAVDEDYPALGTAHPAGDYVYRLSFDLTGFDPSSVVVSGRWGVDNGGSIKLNDAPIVNTTTSYNPLVSFVLTSGFVSGVNHLDFIVANWPSSGSNPTGLRVEDLVGAATRTVSVGDIRPADGLRIFAPRPMPARGPVGIAFELPREGRVRAAVRDLGGRLVCVLADQVFPAGRSEVLWRGERDGGRMAAPGIYFAEFGFGGTKATRRIVRIR